MAVRVALQPTSNKDSRDHYVDTIENPVSLDHIRSFVGDEVADGLAPNAPDGTIATWGVTPGENNVNAKKWRRLQLGDVALFGRDGKVISSGRVIGKVRNEELAVDLWRRNKHGDTWEYVYFLGDMKQQDIAYTDLNAAAGYASNYRIQGFNVLSEVKSKGVIRDLGLGDDYSDLEGATAVAADDIAALVLVENEVTAGGLHDDWKDVTGERYHFPNQYRNRFAEGRRFVYYRGVRRADGSRGTPEYFGMGRIGKVERDEDVPESAPKRQWKWYCEIEDYEPFAEPVAAKEAGNPAFEDIPENFWGVGVRRLSEAAFAGIVQAGGAVPAPAKETIPQTPELQTVAPTEAKGLFIPRVATSSGTTASRGSGTRRSRYSQAVGRRGEEVVWKHLKASLSPEEAKSMRWPAKEGETPGWDIEYTSEDGVPGRDTERLRGHELLRTSS